MDTAFDKNLHAKIKNILAEDGTVLFIGSGISAWSGLPSWGQLLDEMADYVELKGGDSAHIRYLCKTQPLLAADFGYAALRTDDFRTFIRSACRIDVAKPSIVHQLLINLGVSCYITTNYDQLLEQALRRNKMLNNYKVITNREPTDCAGLLYLRRRNFIFKPHGDVEQLESLVLSNKQYDDLYENGNKFYTYRALETLLTTRDVVLVGFGLTDPDFMRIMGKVRNEFKTNLNTHYAIMPDVSQQERDYWAKNYGIQILSYRTKITENGRDYSALLEILDSLAVKSDKLHARVTVATQDKQNIKITKQQKLALGRYAKYLMQQLKIPDGPIFPLTVQRHSRYRTNYYENTPVEEVLSDQKPKFILTGNPGSGKTHFLKQYCITQIKQLQDWCECGKTGKHPKIPVYIDLKNYDGKGSIRTLIESQFPLDIPIMKWIEEGRVTLLFDSFNEVQRKYLENGSCAREIKQFSEYNNIVIATRFKEAVGISLPEYKLDEVEQQYVVEYLENQEIAVSTGQLEMLVQLFQKPLMFHLLVQGKIKIDGGTTPRSIYESYFEYLGAETKKIWNIDINFISIFNRFAYRIFEKGMESFRMEDIEQLLESKLSELKTEERKTIINWLIEVQQFLVPTSLDSISFFHQAITEFLAAHSFAEHFKKNQDILEEKLQYIRWNYVLLFAIEFLDEEQSENYMEILLQTDSLLAVQACSYVEHGANQMVTSILKYLLKNIHEKNFDYFIDLNELLAKLPVAKMHQDILRKLMAHKDIIGGSAARCLLHACGDDVKNELLEEMFQNRGLNQHNYVTSIGESLSEKISLEEYAAVVLRLGSGNLVQDDEDDTAVFGFDTLAQHLPLMQVVEIFQPIDELNMNKRRLLANILRDVESQEGFDICINLIKQGWKEAIFPLYVYARYNDSIYLNNVEESFIQYLVPDIEGQDDKWIIGLIHALYQKSKPFARGIRSRLKQSNGLKRLVYLYAFGKNRTDSFFGQYKNMLFYERLPKELIGQFEQVDWRKEADFIIEMLLYKERLQDLSHFLRGNFNNTRWCDLSLTTFLNLVKTIDELENNNTVDDRAEIYNSLGEFISKYVSKEAILSLYRIGNERIRRFFNFFVLNYLEDLNLQDFTRVEIDFMLEDIKHYSFERDIFYDNEILLVNIADEEFVFNRLKPLLDTENTCLRENVKLILEKAEANHLIRYLER